MASRYALYFSPETGPLAEFGWRILGTNLHQRGVAVERFPLSSIDDDALTSLTETPRNYGFHATMKAPFRLNDGWTEDALTARFRDFCAVSAPASLPATSVQNLNGFLAVMPSTQPRELLQLESAIVTGFEDFRAPLTDAEIARRQPARLTDRQRRYLHAFGYPFIFDEFRFHMTLTGRLPVGAGEMALHRELQDLYQQVVAESDQSVSCLTLAVQDTPSSAFRSLLTCSLKG